MSLLTEEDKQTIAEAIEKAEKATSGEIVFALTDASAPYHDATIQGAVAGMAAATAVWLALPVPHTIGFLLWTQLISFAVFYVALPRLTWRRWLIPSAEMDECVHDAAFTEFYRSGLYKTRDSNGVLIYLSCFEHRVVVLGDEGIHRKMGTAHWNEVRDLIIHGVRAGRSREGIVSAIDVCGRALAEHFPYRSDDTNELSNRVIDRTRGRDAP